MQTETDRVLTTKWLEQHSFMCLSDLEGAPEFGGLHGFNTIPRVCIEFNVSVASHICAETYKPVPNDLDQKVVGPGGPGSSCGPVAPAGPSVAPSTAGAVAAITSAELKSRSE